MTRSLTVLAADGVSSAAPDCSDYWLCQKLYDWFGLDWLAENARVLVATPARILLIVVLAAIARTLVHRAVRRLTDHTSAGAVPAILRPLRNRVAEGDAGEQMTQRRTQRAEAIGSVLRSFASFVILGIAVVLVLGELGINLAPIVASAGVVGVALGFGAQNLIKDFIAGIGIILEDQYGVGDVVDLGEASGTVETVGLRITRLRDVNGVVWYVRNGEVLRVGNKSQGFAQVVIDMPVAHDTDLERARAVMQEVADAMYADEDWAPVLLAEPESLGVEQITAEGVFLRLVVRATNAAQWRVGRELRMRLKERFVAEGIRTPLPLLAGSAGAVAGVPDRARAGRGLPHRRAAAAGHLPRRLRRPRVPAPVRDLPAVHSRRRAGPGGAHRARLPAHVVPAAVGDDLRDQLSAVAAGRTAALRLRRPPPPPPSPRRHGRRACGPPRRDGDPRDAAARDAGAAVPGLTGLSAVRVRALGPHGRRAGRRPLRRRHLTDQHHPAVRPGGRFRPGRGARRRPEPLGRPAHRRGDLRGVGALAAVAAAAASGSGE